MWGGVFKKKTRREARHAVSMRLPLLFCILVFTIVPLLTQSAMLTSTLRQSQVEDTMIHAQNKCLILVNKMLSSDYANSGAKNPIMDTELAVTAELFNGRILVADRNFKIVKDTYGLAEGKFNITEEVLKAYSGETQSSYNKKKDYFSLAFPIQEKEENGMADGVLLFTASTERIELLDSQISEKMGIPAKYLRELSAGDAWQKQLCATILNEHSGWTGRTRVLIRAVGTEIRGVLSDSYRRLNSVDILTAFIREAANNGAVVSDAYMNDTKVWCETILPTPVEIPTRKNGTVIIFAGARFSTSDFGNGSVDMRSFLLNGACLNGMVRESVMRQIHLGGRLPDTLALSQRTYELDTKTTVSAVKDLTKGLYSRDTIMQKAIEIQGASEIDVDFDKELKSLVQRGALLKNEGREVEKLLMNNNPDDGITGGATLWKLAQGITAFAREQEPERSRELHEISGQLINRMKNN